ncbi:hypothetical protein BGZ83_010650 [Gryganskiella cystojenkinii]|nr:hypothetical protein BGZ83_010650 [Gryganskiella cystojenkinii]
MQAHAMEIVEIRCCVAQYVRKPDLKRCLAVSRDWYRTFEPFRWREITVRTDRQEGFGATMTTTPSLDKLLEHAGHIEYLVCQRGIFLQALQDQLYCRNLKSLSLQVATKVAAKDPSGVGNGTNDTFHWEASMIARHRRTLRSLSIIFLPFVDGSKIWETLALGRYGDEDHNWREEDDEDSGGYFPRLTRMTVHDAVVEHKDWVNCWKIWSRLRVLDLTAYFDPTFTRGFDPTTTNVPRRTFQGCCPTMIQELTFSLCSGMTVWDLMGWLKLCPDLIALHWKPSACDLTRGGGISPMRLLALHLKGNIGDRDEDKKKDRGGTNSTSDGDDSTLFCPKLASLTMDNCVFKKQDLTEFLQARSNIGLVKLSVENGQFGQTAWRILRSGDHHLGTLESLNLRGCKSVTGAMVQDMLCSLPYLRALSAPRLTDLDIREDPRSWVCLGLRRLVLDIELYSSVPSTSPVSSVYPLAGSLLPLPLLSTSPPPPPPPPPPSPNEDDSQTMILSRLANLTRLEVFVTNETAPLPGFRTLNLGLVGTTRTPPSWPYISVPLPSGLDLLSSWVHLRKLSMVRATLDWHGSEALWILQHWSSLRVLECTANRDQKPPQAVVVAVHFLLSSLFVVYIISFLSFQYPTFLPTSHFYSRSSTIVMSAPVDIIASVALVTAPNLADPNQTTTTTSPTPTSAMTNPTARAHLADPVAFAKDFVGGGVSASIFRGGTGEE